MKKHKTAKPLIASDDPGFFTVDDEPVELLATTGNAPPMWETTYRIVCAETDKQ